jgi:hypothetical protein
MKIRGVVVSVNREKNTSLVSFEDGTLQRYEIGESQMLATMDTEMEGEHKPLERTRNGILGQLRSLAKGAWIEPRIENLTPEISIATIGNADLILIAANPPVEGDGFFIKSSTEYGSRSRRFYRLDSVEQVREGIKDVWRTTGL